MSNQSKCATFVKKVMICSAIACLIFPLPVLAQKDFPSQPVRIVGANSAGGAADVNARRIATALSQKWDQNVVVQNMPGAGGSVAAGTVANATPNGYTVLFAFHPMLAVIPLIYQKLPFDADKDFASVIFISKTPHVLLVTPSLPVKSVSGLIELAKAKPGTINFGSGGAGSSTHLAGELFKARMHVDIRHIPYRGGAPAAAALMSNEIQMLFDATLTAVGHVKAGRLKPLAIAATSRATALPDVPTFEESGFPGFESTISHGLVVPAKTPTAIIAVLNKAVNEVIMAPKYHDVMTASGAQVIGGAPNKFREFIVAERQKWEPIVIKLNLKK